MLLSIAISFSSTKLLFPLLIQLGVKRPLQIALYVRTLGSLHMIVMTVDSIPPIIFCQKAFTKKAYLSPLFLKINCIRQEIYAKLESEYQFCSLSQLTIWRQMSGLFMLQR